MNIQIRPGAATEDALQIESIIKSIQESMAKLNAAIDSTIPSGIETSWSETLKTNWKTYYGADVEEAMNSMALSATNLRRAVDEAIKYDQEQK